MSVEYLKLLEADDHFARLIQRQIKTGETAGLVDAGRVFISALSEIAWQGFLIERQDDPLLWINLPADQELDE
jgi:hypothetical protein